MTLKSKEIHAVVVGALKVCFHSVFMKVKHTFYFCCTSRRKLRPPFPNTISKQKHNINSEVLASYDIFDRF